MADLIVFDHIACLLLKPGMYVFLSCLVVTCEIEPVTDNQVNLGVITYYPEGFTKLERDRNLMCFGALLTLYLR